MIKITSWHVPILGFNQDRRRETGTEKMWRRLRELEWTSSCLIFPQCWNADFEELAEFMSRNCSDAAVFVYAYSWGAGAGFPIFARQLAARGMIVEKAILCDPVYHSRWRPWRGMFRGDLNPEIVIPGNVISVSWFRQKISRPQAAGLTAESPSMTKIDEPVDLNVRHDLMDDAQEYHDAVFSVVSNF